MMLKWKKPRKVIEDKKGAGVWGGLAPIKKEDGFEPQGSQPSPQSYLLGLRSATNPKRTRLSFTDITDFSKS